MKNKYEQRLEEITKELASMLTKDFCIRVEPDGPTYKELHKKVVDAYLVGTGRVVDTVHRMLDYEN